MDAFLAAQGGTPAEEAVVSIWQLSAIVISPDGRQALMSGQFFCGGLCGGGSYYLLERRGETWAVVGNKLAWVP